MKHAETKDTKDTLSILPSILSSLIASKICACGIYAMIKRLKQNDGQISAPFVRLKTTAFRFSYTILKIPHKQADNLSNLH